MFKWIANFTQSPDGLLHGNSNQSDALNAVNSARNSQNSSENQLSSTFGSEVASNTAMDQGLANQITGSYSNYLNPDNINAMFGDINSTDLSRIAQGDYTGDLYIPGVSGGIDDSLISGMGAVPYQGYQSMSTQGVDYTDPTFTSDFNTDMSDVNTADTSYENFINTGGFTQADIDAMRANAVAPTRQIYQNANDQLTRANEISGGNLGNASVAQSRMASNAADQIGNINTTTEANLAQMVQQGKEFGTTGLAQTSLAAAQARTAVAQLNSQLKEAGLAGMTQIEQDRLTAELQNAQINEQAGAANAQIALGKVGASDQAAAIMAQIDAEKAQLPLTATQGLQTLYGSVPGAENMSNSDLLNLQSIINSGNIGLINAQTGAASIPSGFSSFMGNLGSVLGMGGNAAGGVAGGLLNSAVGTNNMSNVPYTLGNGAQNPSDFVGIDPTTGQAIGSSGLVDPNTGMPLAPAGEFNPYTANYYGSGGIGEGTYYDNSSEYGG